MGWLLTIWLSLPLAPSELQVRMWFSREGYCDFAREKFTENPIMHLTPAGSAARAPVRRAACRELADDEAHLIPEHMRN